MVELFAGLYCYRSDDGSTVSVKGGADDAEFVAHLCGLFKKMIKVVATLDKPYFKPFIEIFAENGTLYACWEYNGEETLLDFVKASGKVPETDAVTYIKELAAALEKMHEKRMVHTNVNPRTVYIGKNGGILLHGFMLPLSIVESHDIRKELWAPRMCAPRYFMAPESFLHLGSITPAADVFSLGAMLFYLVTGNRPPYVNSLIENDTPFYNFAKADMPSPRLVHAIESAMRLRYKERPQNIAEFLQLLEPNKWWQRLLLQK